MVTVLDGDPNALAFLATVNAVPLTPLGVTRFGQSGDLATSIATTRSTPRPWSARRWT